MVRSAWGRSFSSRLDSQGMKKTSVAMEYRSPTFLKMRHADLSAITSSRDSTTTTNAPRTTSIRHSSLPLALNSGWSCR